MTRFCVFIGLALLPGAVLRADSVTCNVACTVSADPGVTVNGTLSWTAGSVAVAPLTSLGYGPWDDALGPDITQYGFAAAYTISGNIELSDPSVPDGNIVQGKISAPISLPASPDGWLVLATGLNWSPGGGGDPNVGELDAFGEFYYGDTYPYVAQYQGTTEASISTAIVGPGTRAGISGTETYLELVMIPEPALWPLAAAFVLLICMLRLQKTAQG